MVGGDRARPACWPLPDTQTRDVVSSSAARVRPGLRGHLGDRSGTSWIGYSGGVHKLRAHLKGVAEGKGFTENTLRIGYSKKGLQRKCEEQNDFHWQGKR